MLMRKAKVKHDGSREFRPSWFTRLWTFAAAGFFLFVAFVVARDKAPWYAMLCVIPLFSFIGWFAFIQATQMTLTVRDEGLEYRFGSGTVTTPWANLRRFLYHSTGRTSTMGVELGSSVRQQVHGGKLDKAFFGEEPVHYIPLSDIVSVPTVYDKEKKQARVDLEKFAKTPFGQELLHHAPHLFEESAAILKHKS
jgi:hypothetical protein